MNKHLALLLAAIALCATALFLLAPATSRTALQPGQLPLRDLVLSGMEDCDFQISPDGKRLAWRTFDGKSWAIATRRVAESASAVFKAPPGPFKWMADSRHILFSQAQEGTESWDLFVADMDEPKKPARNVSKLKSGFATYLGRANKAGTEIFFQHNERDGRTFDLASVDIADGSRKLITTNPGNVTAWLVDGGVLRARIEQHETTRTLVLLDADRANSHQPVHTERLRWSVADTLIPIGFGPDAKNLWVVSDLGSERVGLHSLNLANGKLETVLADPKVDLDIEENLPVLGPRTRQPVLAVAEAGYPRVFVLDAVWDKALAPIRASGNVRIGLQSMDDHERLATIKVFDGVGVKTWLVDRELQQMVLLAEGFFSRKPDLVARSIPIQVPSRDGWTLHGFITMPNGAKPGDKLPMVVRVHGGPWYHNVWGNTDLPAAATQVQFLANRGYAVLEINFRGSTGFGRKFKDAGAREFGKKMQDDLVDGVKWAVAAGFADPSRIAIMGTSYGGYAALMGVSARSAQPFACAIAIAAPSDLAGMVEEFPATWALEMHQWRRFVGDPRNAAERAAMLAVSPISHVDTMDKPLLLVHGLQDPIVRSTQSDTLATALKRKGKEVSYLPFADEGHAISGVNAQLQMYTRVEGFLAKCLEKRDVR